MKTIDSPSERYFEKKRYNSISIQLNYRCSYVLELVDDELCVCLKRYDTTLVYTPLHDVKFFISQIKALEKIICLTIPEREMLLELGRYDELANAEKKKLNKLRMENDIEIKNAIIEGDEKETPLLLFYNLKNRIRDLIDNKPVNVDHVNSSIQKIDAVLHKRYWSIEPI